MTLRRLITTGTALEQEIGFSRAVRVGNQVFVSGTAPIGPRGGSYAKGDVYRQTRRCLQIIENALAETGSALTDVTRTRIMLTDITQWREAARAHGEVFAEIRPACTFVQVSAFIDPDWLVEVEAEAVTNS